MKTAPEVAREVLYRISDGRMADDCGGKVGCPYCKPYIDAIADAIAAAEARGRDAGLMEAAKIVSDLSTKEHQARNDLAFYALNRAWHALNALTPTPSGAGDKGGGDNGQR